MSSVANTSGVSTREFRERLKRRAKAANIPLEPTLVDGLETYYQLLTKWNAKINLTAFQLTPAGEDEAIDRLLIEPVVAARYVPQNARTLLDAGSGGGSPAIPLKLASPQLHVRLVEVKTRKAVFLREAVRTLGLRNAEVETRGSKSYSPGRASRSARLGFGPCRSHRDAHVADAAGVSPTGRQNLPVSRRWDQHGRNRTAAALGVDGKLSAGRRAPQQAGCAEQDACLSG